MKWLLTLILAQLSLNSFASERVSHGQKVDLGPCSCAYYTKKNYRNTRQERSWLRKYVVRDYTCTYICQTPNGEAHFVDGEYTDREKLPHGDGSEFICDGLSYEGKTHYRQIKGVYHELYTFELIPTPGFAFNPQSSRSIEVQQWGQAYCANHKTTYSGKSTISSNQLSDLAEIAQ